MPLLWTAPSDPNRGTKQTAFPATFRVRWAFAAVALLSLAATSTACSSGSPSSSAVDPQTAAASSAARDLVLDTTVTDTTVTDTTVQDEQWPPLDLLASDYAEVATVAVVRLTEPTIVDRLGGSGSDDSCGYALVRARAKVIEVFKGSLVAGTEVFVGWTIECPVRLDRFFPGERVLFGNPQVPRLYETDWVALENSTIEATPRVIEALRALH